MTVKSKWMSLALACCGLISIILCGSTAAVAAVPAFTIGWSVYAGWNPYAYMQESGILKKWADKYGITIKLQRSDYAASLASFVAKNIDACTMTNMEALTTNVDSTAIIVGDYSNGNDVVLARDNLTFDKLSGQPILLMRKSVSEYLLERGMVLNGQEASLSKLRLVHMPNSDIVAAFMSNRANKAVVTWEPLASKILSDKGVHSIFDSSRIPGEILDLLVVRTEVLSRPDGAGVKFAKAITGAWYETIQNLTESGQAQEQALKISAAASGDSVASYKEQLKTTYFFSYPRSAVAFTSGWLLKQRMEVVRQFCFEHGLGGNNIQSADELSIAYPDGSIQGRKDQLRLRFSTVYMQAARDRKL